MSIFQKYPICGAFAFAQPNCEFKCENDHAFKLTKSEKNIDDEVWEHMPEWARLLKKKVG